MITAFVLAAFGLLLIYLEFFFPSGVSAVIAAGLLITSIIFFGFRGYAWGWIAFYSIILLVLVLLVCKMAIGHVKGRVSHKADQEGYIAAPLDKTLIGAEGVAISELKPSGHILVQGKKLPAQSDTGYIPQNTSVIITGVRGANYIVKTKE
ncbi:MAG: hypothetical protein JSR58_07835 [Verrucomicrobia bacterium]|nr:hypothetical protein [Verrucomicrobiota bacterium]